MRIASHLIIEHRDHQFSSLNDVRVLIEAARILATRSTSRAGGDAIGATPVRGVRQIKLKLDLQIDARLVLLGLYLGGLFLRLLS